MTNNQFLEVIKSTIGVILWDIDDNMVSCELEDKYQIVIIKESTDWFDTFKANVRDMQTEYSFTLDGDEIEEAYKYISETLHRRYEDKFYNYMKSYARKKKFQTLKDNEEDD